MKKHFLYLSLLTDLLIVCFAFTACGGDDGDDTGTGPTVNGKRIVSWTSVEVDDRWAGHETTGTLEYNSKGQIIQGSNNDYVITYVYENSKIIRTTNSSESITYNLSDGRIVSDSDGNTYEYDSNGYIKKMVIKGNGTYDFIWDYGNIAKIIKNNDRTTTFTYTTISTSLLPLYNYGDNFLYFDDILAMQGYYGKRCKNLPSSTTHNKGDNMYDYTITNGVVTKSILYYTSDHKMIYTYNWE